MENDTLLNLSPVQLRRAAELKERIDGLNRELSKLLGGGHVGNRVQGSGGAESTGKPARRKMSAAGRARIAAAARARWAKVKSSGGSSLAAKAVDRDSSPKKRTMSAAARARIAAAAKARWAKVRAAKAKS